MSGNGPVLVVGGTGMLGGQVVTELLSRGKRVRALVRPTSDAKSLERAGVEIVPDIPGIAKVIPTRSTPSATTTSPTPPTGPAFADSSSPAS